MNLLVKRFLVFAVPLLVLGSSNAGYSIQVENNAGIELANFSITDHEREFVFGDLAERTCTGLGNADLQFGPESPRNLQVAFKPKNGGEIITHDVDVPLIGAGQSIKLSVDSWLDLVSREAR